MRRYRQTRRAVRTVPGAQMPHPLMTARWSSVCAVAFGVPPTMLGRFMPPVSGNSLEPDLWEQRGGRRVAVAILEARRCTHVRVFGVRWPGLGRFSSVSLRFAVRQGDSRGAVYLREIMPGKVMAWIGERAFNQPIAVAPVEVEVKQQLMLMGAEYRVRWGAEGSAGGRGGEHQMMRVVGTKPPALPAPGSVEAWLMQRPFVFGMDRKGQGLVYEVIHQPWGVYPAADVAVRFDFARVFGPEWGFLADTKPMGGMLGVGGQVAVFPRRRSVAVRWGVRREGMGGAQGRRGQPGPAAVRMKG